MDSRPWRRLRREERNRSCCQGKAVPRSLSFSGRRGHPAPTGLLPQSWAPLPRQPPPRLWGTLGAVGTPSCPKVRLWEVRLLSLQCLLQVGKSGLAYGPVRETEAKGASWCLSGPTRKASTPSLQPNWGLLTASTAQLPRSLLELGRDGSIPRKEPRGPRPTGTAPGSVTAPDGSEGLGSLCPTPMCGPVLSHLQDVFCCAHFTDGKTQASGSIVQSCRPTLLAGGGGLRPGRK